MKATELLHNLGQSLWLDNITRDLLDDGTLERYVDEFSVTGLTSNPTIFDHAIKNSAAYDAAIRDGVAKGRTGEALFFDLAQIVVTAHLKHASKKTPPGARHENARNEKPKENVRALRETISIAHSG